jgi:hypothetical protein
MSGTTKTNFRKLADLIKVCGDNGVRRLKFQDVEVEFSEVAKQSGPIVTPVSLAGEMDAPAEFQNIEEKAEAGFEGLSQQSLMEELEIAQQLMDDPAGFEADQIAMSIEKQRIEGHKREARTVETH